MKELSLSDNARGLGTLYDNVNANVCSLEALGVKQEEYAVLFHTSLAAEIATPKPCSVLPSNADTRSCQMCITADTSVFKKKVKSKVVSVHKL